MFKSSQCDRNDRMHWQNFLWIIIWYINYSYLCSSVLVGVYLIISLVNNARLMISEIFRSEISSSTSAIVIWYLSLNSETDYVSLLFLSRLTGL